jgi:hypothetical protein
MPWRSGLFALSAGKFDDLNADKNLAKRWRLLDA